MKILKLLFLFLFIVSCNQNKKKNGSPDDKTQKSQNKVAFDSTKIAPFFKKFPNLEIAKRDVISFYKQKNYTYAWFDGSKISQQASVLQSQIQNISSEVLADKKLYPNEFSILLKDKASPNLETELMLTSQYFIYAKNVWFGLTEKETKDINWHLPRKKLDFNALLDSITNGNPVLQNPPIFKQYMLLKNQLKNYQSINQAGGFPIIDKKSIGLKVGDSSATITNLKKWFILSKDLDKNNSNQVFDANLENAIKKFKTNYGLEVDGTITTNLLKEMNVSASERMIQIKLNMERCRWLPVGRVRNYLLINIPEYKMHVFENDNLIWSMDAVVGKTTNETAIFSDKIEYIVFSPFWNVPKSILKKEILPGIARNKNYLNDHNMEWFNGNVRQKPGPKNSLGLVKFMFPNTFDIYLHDTPAKSLFNETNRAFSHGCIRLQNAEKLANYLLKNDNDWNAEKIKAAMNGTEEKIANVKKQKPVFIVYFTSWVDRNGQLNFRKDIYNRDSNLKTILLAN